MIELAQITKTYHGGKANAFTAIRNVDLTIQANQVTVIKGPSGSGKTTLLSLVGCMARPTSGRIHLNGREISSLPERFSAEIRRSTFGFIFQSFNLIKGMTVLENIMIPAYPLGREYRALKKKALRLLELLQIKDKAYGKVELLSGGEKQRVAIARALINDPPVIVADEPTAHLDTELARAFLDAVTTLRKDGKTVLVASHDSRIYDAPVVDRVVAMRDGGIIAEDGV